MVRPDNFAAVLAALTIAFASAGSASAAEVHPGMLRFPDVSSSQIVFIYDNDVWIAPKEGGVAVPLSSPAGMETFPRFSPDGSKIAYSASYDGNEDVYEIPATGGMPRRLTVQPYGARVIDYSPDGRVVYGASEAAIDETQLWYADPSGGLPTRLPIRFGDMVSFSSDGTWVAFAPWRHLWQEDSWNRYQGGQAADIWTFNLATNESKQITNWTGTDDVPMVSGTRIFYLSDAGPEHRRNIWLYDTANGEQRQVTNFTDAETRWPAIGPSDIVFQNGGKLWRMPLNTLSPVEVHISLSGDLPHARPRTLNLEGFPDDVMVSPQAKRLVVEKRGDIWTIPAREGYPVNLTPTDGVAERSPVWSPDGKTIAYICDDTPDHHYEVCLRPADGTGEAKALTSGSETRMYGLQWSPDSKRIAYVDRTSTYWWVDVATGKKTKIATDPYGSFNNWIGGAINGAWAPDSRWLAYTVRETQSTNSVIHIYNCDTAEDHVVTEPVFESFYPVFDASGDYLYYASNQAMAPVYSDVDDDIAFANSTVLAYLPLRADVKSPFIPRSDEETVKPAEDAKDKPADGKDGKDKPKDDKAAKDGKGKDGAKADAAAAPKPVAIDFDGITARSRQLPMENGNYGNLQCGSGKLYYMRYPRTGASGGVAELKLFDFAAAAAGDPANPADKTLLSDVNGFQLTPDASKLLVFARNSLFITNAAPGAALDKQVPLPALRKELDPQREWHQMIWEDWRIFKEKFYDPNMHGVNWDAARDRALAKLPYVACPEDVGFIISEMNGEVNVGHAYVAPASSGWTPGVGLGLLGCDFERASDAAGKAGIRISRIYRGNAAQVNASGPLDVPGTQVKAGEFLLAVNGVALDPAKNPYERLLGQGGKTVKLTVGPNATKDDKARDVLVTPTGWDASLRHAAWVEKNRQYVHEKSGGKVGYLHIRDTGYGGICDLQRQLIGEHNRQALIVDERYNHGGNIAHRFIELLNRPYAVYCAPRYGLPARIPALTAPGPKVMLINQYAGSGGDCFPFLFREHQLGKLIGVRTWGGLVGLSGGETLLDGTHFVVPSLAIYNNQSQWIAEGYGVDPDIEVVNDPTSVAAGQDPQLDRAIAEALAEAEAHPWADAPIPVYCDKSGCWIGPPKS
jgi:tricorn protease